MEKIVLMGYMGSGKSTIGKLVADKLNFNHLDLDFEIEKEVGMSVSEIFLIKGELFFRKFEHELLLKLLASKEKMVLSLGGGTPCYFNNHESIVKKSVFSIYLKASIATIMNRLDNETSKRPLLANLEKNNQEEIIAKHLFERSYFYSKATITLSVNDKSPEEVVDFIVKKLG